MSQVKTLIMTNTENLLGVYAGTASHQYESEECTVCGTSDTVILNLSALIMW